MFKLCVIATVLVYHQASQASAIVAFEGPCPENVTAVGDFDMDRFLGKWYTYSMYPHLSSKLPICQSTEFKRIDDNTYEAKGVELDSKSETVKVRSEKITNVNKGGSYDLMSQNGAYPDGIPISVLETDYDNFAVRFLCFDSNKIFNFQWAIIETRTRMPDPKYLQKAQMLAKEAGLRLSSMIKVPQDACPEDT